MSYYVFVLLYLSGSSIQILDTQVVDRLDTCYELFDKAQLELDLPRANWQPVCIRGEE